jgi:citrate lyase subunit beta / citryl-CoA lyase
VAAPPFGTTAVESPARQLVWRSLLIMPVNVPAFVEKAPQRGADAIVLDLEDSIPPAEKANARRLVKDAIVTAGRGGSDVLVRTNHAWELAEADLESAVWPGLNGIAYPKVEQVEQVQRVDETLSRLERQRGLEPGSVSLSILIETATGLLNARELAHASPRLVSISLGGEDFALDLGIEPTTDGTEMLYGRLFIVLIAREAGLYPLGLMGSLAEYRDLDVFRRSVDGARQVGYRGASCIHPTQVPLLNEGFSPAPAEVEYARRVIAAYQEAEAQGRASIGLDGKMIDIPVLERARRTVARADQIAALEARKRAALGSG